MDLLKIFSMSKIRNHSILDHSSDLHGNIWQEPAACSGLGTCADHAIALTLEKLGIPRKDVVE